MKFSLLNRKTDGIERGRTAESNAIYDLLIDKLVEAFEPNYDRAENFLHLLREPPLPENILYRQGVLKDFLNNPQLMDDLRESFKSYDDMRRDWQELRSAMGTYSSLKTTAVFISNTLSHFSAVRELTERYELQSEGLNALKAWLLETSNDSAIRELSEICALWTRDNITDYEWQLNARLSETLRLDSVSVSSVAELTETSLLKRIFAKRMDDGAFDLGEFHSGEAHTMLSDAIDDVYFALTTIAGALYEIFRGLSAELDFYVTASNFTEYLRKRDMAVVFPDIVSSGIEIAEVYDPLLITEGLNKEKIVSNDFKLGETSNLIIRGENAAGKTSFLRAVGISVIFASAGLPVCAGSANIACFREVFTQFSKAETLSALDEAGRFEQEVRELSGIVHGELADSLIILNETFQSTSYSEASSAIIKILQRIERAGARWIFVTHLSPLLNAPPSSSSVAVMDSYVLRSE
jgi:DNA mismatch repair ATPase MutS